MNLMTLLPYLSTVLAICITIGGLIAVRAGYVKQASEIQDRVIAALKAQNEAQEVQIHACEKEITRLKRVVTTIQYALKRRGLSIEIDGDAITLIDNPQNTRTVQIQISDKDDEQPIQNSP